MFIVITNKFSYIISDLSLILLIIDNIHESSEPSIKLINDFLFCIWNTDFFIDIAITINWIINFLNCQMLILNKLKEN